MNKESCGFGKKCKRGYKPSPVNRELYKKLKINHLNVKRNGKVLLNVSKRKCHKTKG